MERRLLAGGATLISPSRIFASGALLALATNGCYSVTNGIRESRSVERSQVRERLVERALAHETRIELSLRVDDGRVRVSASTVRRCRTDTEQVYSRAGTVERTLPGSYGWFVGVSLAIAGAGAGIWVAGADKVNDTDSIELGSPIVEQDRDRGHQLTLAGQVATGAGMLMLVSALYDLVSASDSRTPLAEEVTTVRGMPRDCLRSPAGDMDLVLATEEVRLSLVTDERGEASVALVDDSLRASRYRAPFGSVFCNPGHASEKTSPPLLQGLCQPVELVLGADDAAHFVLHTGRLADLEDWRDTHRGHVRTPEVIRAITRLRRGATSRQLE